MNCTHILIFTFLTGIFIQPLSAKDLTFSGEIGDFPVLMKITEIDWETGYLSGDYHYVNKEGDFEIKGEILSDCVILSEFYEGENTGDFYLQLEKGYLTGKLISGNDWFNVKLKIGKSGTKKLAIKTLEDYSEACNSGITGAYLCETHFINDMWFEDDKPELEIGFNGGKAIIERINKDSVEFLIEVYCGPTYHMAYAKGVAINSGVDKYTCIYEATEEDTCRIVLSFSDRSIHASAFGGFSCGFEPRAYLDHVFTKVSDRHNFREEASGEEIKRFAN